MWNHTSLFYEYFDRFYPGKKKNHLCYLINDSTASVNFATAPPLFYLFYSGSLLSRRGHSSDLNTCDHSNPSASHNKSSNETSNPSNENGFHGLLKHQPGSPDPGTYFWIV